MEEQHEAGFLPYGLTESEILSLGNAVPAYLTDLERDTRENLPGAHMLTGGVQGRILALFSRLICPKRVLEIGTYSGYGALCLAEGLAADGKVFTLERSADHAAFARKHLEASPFASRIVVLEGIAAEILPQLRETWDLVYLDGDKAGNFGYAQTIWPALRPGGLLMIDNVFVRGGIRKAEAEQRPFEKAVSQLNRELPDYFPDSWVTNLPIRDGLTLVWKSHLPK